MHGVLLPFVVKTGNTPHAFRPQNWKNYMIASTVSVEDRKEAARLTMDTVRDSRDDILQSLQALDIDLLGAFAVSAENR